MCKEDLEKMFTVYLNRAQAFVNCTLQTRTLRMVEERALSQPSPYPKDGLIAEHPSSPSRTGLPRISEGRRY
jgi:hypothetical protein